MSDNTFQKKVSGQHARDEVILSSLREELVGPAPLGEPLDCSSSITFASREEAAGNWVQKSSGDEILKTSPLKRYGTGILYPTEIMLQNDADDRPEAVSASDDEAPPLETDQQALKDGDSDDSDFDVSTANARFPSSMAISFFCDLSHVDSLSVHIQGGIYLKQDISVAGKGRTWWTRQAIDLKKQINISTLSKSGGPISERVDNIDGSAVLKQNGIDLWLKGIIRQEKMTNATDGMLVTIALVNCSPDGGPLKRNMRSLFQSGFSVTVRSPDGKNCILPYPQKSLLDSASEQKSNALLYRNDQVFAVGHGCATDWDARPGDGKQSVSTVITQSLPDYEVPSITPDIEMANGSSLAVSMEALANYAPGSDGQRQLRQLVDEYSSWIDHQKKKISRLDKPEWQATAKQHLSVCEKALLRMSAGLTLIDTDNDVRKAFQLANQAMLLQQQHAPKVLRKPTENDWGQISFENIPFKENDIQGTWRAFQIGFILMALVSVADEDDDFHELVDLIWFATGGGKTEAYLGLASFSMLYHRIVYGQDADNTQAIMRYTLRLLTAQQLQRAAALICALETIRINEKIAGKSFSVGLWVGSTSTPNTRTQAISSLNKLIKKKGQNPFLITRCPWCGAQMGPLESQGKTATVLGYEKRHGSVAFACPDHSCAFSKQIPVYVIDEDIYAERPSLLIGTVDKFAMLPWKPEIRSLFGIDENGKRELKPPALIIQDELHLISGPLGTMVSLYEPLIEELCTDRRHSRTIRPKIICATATTCRYREQIQTLYGRNNTELFPPPGLDASDSFFARYARDAESNLKPGRKYVGVCAPGLGSMMTTQVRCFSALMCAEGWLQTENRDPWHTLLVFYNSLRELGGGLTLFQSDIPGYMTEIYKRLPSVMPKRFINRVEELTSRLNAEEIPLAIDKLMKQCLTVSDQNFLSAVKDILAAAQANTDIQDLVTPLSEYTETNQSPTLEQQYQLYAALVKARRSGIPMTKNMMSVLNGFQGKGIVDACLASNVIEVGVDIDRLGLMAIIGQPKTTAQYIQVSGRVGRQWWERPGLVVTLYSTAKPRDRSHYEHFRGYHQQLYAQVEPSSVTPWSVPALERALHGLLFGYFRQFSPIDIEPNKIYEELFSTFRKHFLETRSRFMTEEEQSRTDTQFSEIMRRLKERQPDLWGDFFDRNEGRDLMYPLGSQVPVRYANKSFSVPTSMRFVDGESTVLIDNPYATDQGVS